jgi:hypothetical protein
MSERRECRAATAVDRASWMSEQEFWSLIERTTDPDGSLGQASRLTEHLSQLTVEQVLGFDLHFARFHQACAQGRLWCAAYVMLGACSEEDFEHFRSGLIGRGRAVFEAALADPDSLVDLDLEVPHELQDEDLPFATTDAWTRITGEDDEAFWRTVAGFQDLPEPAPVHLDWDPDDPDSMAAIVPRLMVVYGI